MLLKFLTRWARRKGADPSSRTPDLAMLDHAQERLLAGDNQAAIQAYREYLKTDPYNVSALNDLGACLVDSGDIAQGVTTLELAYTLDDTFVPVMVNYAKLLNDHYKRGADALRLLRRARISRPEFSHTDAVYAGVCFKRGEAALATRYQLKAWLANFDNLRLGNGVMFWGSYDAAERDVAAEHFFWGATLKPLEPLEESASRASQSAGKAESPVASSRRIRIGYWSPDFRGHSVRFFFRPLLENHDRDKFEIVLFHDCPLPDDQTAKIEAAAEQFHDVHELPDPELRAFIRAQRLDVLVDLAGHTSFNRLALLQDKLAPLQVNAIGYPPTTGLRSVDAKLIDRHVATASDAQFYAEEPMVLESSFWCFDPMEDVADPSPPPVLRNGHITYACVGNIAKITAPVLGAWKQILERVPDARLLIRAINFEDAIALEAMNGTLQAAEIPRERVDLVPPKGGADFYGSYNEIDVILDTFPFNGGTTTCFATYMGVPVVTLAGESLLTRMGLSVMTNLGAPEYAVRTLDDYVERAVAAARDVDGLARFRAEVRNRYRASALGNGKLFAREFEAAVNRMLAERTGGGPTYEPRPPMLPEAEIMRRAYAIVRRGQVEAAERVAAFCLACYPGSGKPHLLKAQLLVWGQAHAEALAYLRARLAEFSVADRVSALLVIARVQLLLAQYGAAGETLAAVRALEPSDPFDRQQTDFYAACVEAASSQSPDRSERASNAAGAVPANEKVLVMVPCDDLARFDQIRDQIVGACACPGSWTLEVRRCAEADRIAAYESALADTDPTVVVFVQKNVTLHGVDFLAEIATALQGADLAGCAGGRRFERLDWRLDEFEQKTGSFITPSSEREGHVEVHWFGSGADTVHGGLQVLDGSVVAVRRAAGPFPPFSEELLAAGTLLEEAWTHACARQGHTLAVHRCLGVFIDSAVPLDESDRTEARVSYALERAFDPFADENDDYLSVSAPALDAAAAVAICRTHLANA